MTVTYADEVATAKGSTLLKLLFSKWRGSVLKLLWKDLLVFLTLYYSIQIIYQFTLSANQKEVFEAVVLYSKIFHDNTPLSFLLGSFVSNVFDLWWKQFNMIPFITTLAINVTSSLQGFDEVGRAMRRTIMRYACLSITMTFRIMSPRVNKRFPQMENLIEAGLINEDELNVLKELDSKFPGYGKYWLPICWAASLATKAREDGRIRDDFALKAIIQCLNDIIRGCASVMNCSMVYIPLIYIHVVIIAVYTYFLTALFAAQYIQTIDRGSSVGVIEYIPILTILKFVFYMGWLKVAETMMNPFGNDDDDFEINSFIDANLQMSYIIVDEIHAEHPELLKDQYWDEIPTELPDKGKEKSVSFHKEKGDIFDAVSSKMKNILIDMGSNESSKSSKSSLKPKADVIDKSYSRLGNATVEKTQNSIERLKMRQKLGSSSSESDN